MALWVGNVTFKDTLPLGHPRGRHQNLRGAYGTHGRMHLESMSCQRDPSM